MSRDFDSLFNAYLDDLLTPEEVNQFEQQLRQDPERARQFAAAVMLHDRIRSEMSATKIAENHGGKAPVGLAEARSGRRRSRFRAAIAVMSAACLMLLAIAWWNELGQSTVVAADVALSQIIEASAQEFDRSYLIVASDETKSPADVVPGKHNRGAKPPIDGALLHVRGPSSYVLVRRYADDTEFVTGSNGQESWAVPPRGKVRVSGDPKRFSGQLPGSQHAIPFVDLNRNLSDLRDAYELSVSSEPDDAGWYRLEATRRESARGGPKNVVIWYEPETGTIQRMLMDRLPQAKGGPRSLWLELVSRRDLGPDFYQHQAHHEAEREVIKE